jgi:phospholipase/lecithinase/hemolysin
MNPIFSRTLKALCAVVAVSLLTACGGSSSTVDPFKPTRVIGLGDGYNNANATVQETGSTTGTVFEQVATYFGQSNTVSYATPGARIGDLAAQINSVGTFSAGDLVVIAAGTFDVKASATPATEAQTLVTQVQRLKTAGVQHILIMPVLDLSRTPWGRANSFDTTATNTFNTAVLSALSAAFGGQTPNSVIFANASGVTSLFLTATSVTTFSPFTDTGYNGTSSGTTPACGTSTLASGTSFTTPSVVGCAASAITTPYTTMLFADGIHLTPAGNRWVAQYLYNATGQGWR